MRTPLLRCPDCNTICKVSAGLSRPTFSLLPPSLSVCPPDPCRPTLHTPHHHPLPLLLLGVPTSLPLATRRRMITLLGRSPAPPAYLPIWAKLRISPIFAPLTPRPTTLLHTNLTSLNDYSSAPTVTLFVAAPAGSPTTATAVPSARRPIPPRNPLPLPCLPAPWLRLRTVTYSPFSPGESTTRTVPGQPLSVKSSTVF